MIENLNLDNPPDVFESDTPENWAQSCVHEESTIHQLSPYVGKLKSVIAREFIREFSKKGDLVVDPFCGSGTVLLESILNGRNALGLDISPYAVLLTKAKLSAPSSENYAKKRCKEIIECSRYLPEPDLRSVPKWVRDFFHPQTLREIIKFVEICKQEKNSSFYFACLLGILHHQRPGFLSYPSSHLVPYLRDIKYPRKKYPELYGYRDLETRINAKIERAFKRHGQIDKSLSRVVKLQSIRNTRLPNEVDCIITSPPYMSALDYGRDNRLRLWFMGGNCAHDIDNDGTHIKSDFIDLMVNFGKKAECALKKKGYCVIIVGEKIKRSGNNNISKLVIEKLDEACPKLKLKEVVYDKIPDIRRARKEIRGVRNENFLIYQKK